MSCKHGNWSSCDLCDEESAIYDRAFRAGMKKAASICDQQSRGGLNEDKKQQAAVDRDLILIEAREYK